MRQKTALDILKAGRSVFLTGAAGTGKTYVLNEYIKHLREHGVSVGVTASTGIAATHLNGMTVHSWSGIGIKDHLSEWDLDALTQKQYLVKRFEKTQVLIIDEISMLHPGILDMVDQVCKTMKRRERPFGGMQVVLSGDFFQLPPVVRGGGDEIFADSARCWSEADIRVCYLTEQYRHEDNSYARLLNDIRDGNVSVDAHKKLNSRINASFGSSSTKCDNIEVTRLYTHNADVDARNNKELAKLRSKAFKFEMRGRGKKNLIEALKRGVLAPETLELKKDAVVMFVKNDREGRYVNGTVGKVAGFESSWGERLPVVETLSGEKITVEIAQWNIEEDGKALATVEQIPLRLAWAITVHKSQGMSLDAAEIDLSRAFTPGQGYVALSRLRTLDGLVLTGLNTQALQMHPYVVGLDLRLRAQSQKWERVVGRFESDEMKGMHDTFILDAGGSLDKEEIRKEKAEAKLSTLQKTERLIKKAKTIKDIAKERGLKEETIISHFEQLFATARQDLSTEDIEKFNTLSKKDFAKIKKVFDEVGKGALAPVRRRLKNMYSYKDLRLARLFV